MVDVDKNSLAHSGAVKLLNMSPARRFHMVERLLTSSPSRQRIVHELLKEGRDGRSDYRPSSFGTLSPFEDNAFVMPPESPLIVKVHSCIKKTPITLRCPPMSPDTPKYGVDRKKMKSSSTTSHRRAKRHIRRSPLTLKCNMSSFESCPSSSLEFSPVESPMFGIRKSPVTISSSFDTDISDCSRSLSRSPPPLSPYSNLVRKMPPSESSTHNGSPLKRVRKNPY